MSTPTILHASCVAFLTFLKEVRQYAFHTIKSYTLDLNLLSSKLLATKTPEEVTDQDIRALVRQLHSQSLSAQSIARALSCWHSYYRWLLDQEIVSHNPVSLVKAPRRPKSLPKALSVEETMCLMDSAVPETTSSQLNQAMFELLYSSGLRVAELVSLDIHYFHGASYTSSSWIDLSESTVYVMGKGKKRRDVPIGQQAVIALRAWLIMRENMITKDPHALFLNSRGRRISTRLVQLKLKRHAAQLSIQKSVHPHVLRHACASHLLQSSGDLRAVQEFLGHTSLASTQIYTALDFQHLAQVYDRAHPRARIK